MYNFIGVLSLYECHLISLLVVNTFRAWIILIHYILVPQPMVTLTGRTVRKGNPAVLYCTVNLTSNWLYSPVSIQMESLYNNWITIGTWTFSTYSSTITQYFHIPTAPASDYQCRVEVSHSSEYVNSVTETVSSTVYTIGK